MNASTFLRRFVLALSLAAVAISARASHGETANLPTVHVVGIGDLALGGDFGRKVAEDAENTVAVFEQAFAKAGRSDHLNTRLVLGDDVTPDNVLKVIASLNVKPNDTLVVLYSGHGCTAPDHKHMLTFRHGELTRERLLAGMKAKNPRLMVLLTDCCSSGIVAASMVPRYQPRSMNVGVTMDWDTIDSLFLRHGGLVDMTAAEPGFAGKIDLQKSGSLFTNALLYVLKTPHAELVRNLDRDGDGRVQWDEILPQVRGLAAQYDSEQFQGDAQQAYATSLGRWMPAAPSMTP